MNVYRIPHTDFKVSRIAYGCMGIGGRWNREPVGSRNNGCYTEKRRLLLHEFDRYRRRRNVPLDRG